MISSICNNCLVKIGKVENIRFYAQSLSYLNKKKVRLFVSALYHMFIVIVVHNMTYVNSWKGVSLIIYNKFYGRYFFILPGVYEGI